MSESIDTSLERRQIQASAERCVAARESITQTTEVIAVSRHMIAGSRSKIAHLAVPCLPIRATF
jgi:hypothetical protein